MYSVGEEGQELCLMSFKFCYMEYNTKEKKIKMILYYCIAINEKKIKAKRENLEIAFP